MADDRTERVFRRVVEVADLAVERYRVFAGREHPREIADLLRGLVDEARRRSAEVERAYFLVVGTPPTRLGGDGASAEDELGRPASATDLLRRTLEDFREVHTLIRAAATQVAPGLARRTLVDLARSEESRIAAFAAVYRDRLVPGSLVPDRG
jgi:hypothetical protein